MDLKSASDTGLKAPFEDYISRLLFCVPAPPRGIT